MAGLGDIIEQIRGVSYKPTDLRDILDENSVPLFRANNIQDGNINLDDLVYVSKNKVAEKQYLKKGDILICASSGSKELVGKAAYIEQDMSMTFGAFCKVVRPKTECPKYIGHFFQSSYYRRSISDLSAGVNINNIRNEHIANLEILLPTLEEQRRITALLDKVSDLIAKRRAQLDKLDLLVKARFVEMFDGIYEQVLLSDVAEITGGLTKNSKRKDLPIKLPYLRVANVFFDTIDTNEILEIGLTEEEKSKTLLQKGDLLFVEGNGSPEQIGRVAVWRDEIVPCVHQNHLIKARFNMAKMLPIYAMNYFMTQKGREQIREKAVSTSGLYTLSVSKIESLHIPFAPMDTQLQFTDFKEKVDKSKMTIYHSLDKLETLKKALMQQYFG